MESLRRGFGSRPVGHVGGDSSGVLLSRSVPCGTGRPRFLLSQVSVPESAEVGRLGGSHLSTRGGLLETDTGPVHEWVPLNLRSLSAG